jgi:hypothetical protein
LQTFCSFEFDIGLVNAQTLERRLAVFDRLRVIWYDFRTITVRSSLGGAMDDLEKRIKEELDKFWDERALPSGPGGATTVDELLGPLESMTAVEVLATLDGIVGAKLPNSVIHAGGYNSKGEFRDKLTARVLAHLKKQQKG